MKISRRHFITGIPAALFATLGADALIEPHMLEETFLDKSDLGLVKKIVHISDLHFKGDLEYSQKVVEIINNKKPDFVFFTGDLVESGSNKHLQQALAVLKGIRSPCFAVPGNHDPKDNHSLGLYSNALNTRGGELLQNERIDLGDFVLHGADGTSPLQKKEDKKKMLLCHYPIVGNAQPDQEYDLILCGHSHGGQVRIPFYGALILPFGVGSYVSGFYRTNAGRLYVNRGIGEFLIPVRLFCRPEITEIKI